jgi:hypothetical protein
VTVSASGAKNPKKQQSFGDVSSFENHKEINFFRK